MTRTREDWLNEAVDLIRPWFDIAGHPAPKKVRCSIGFPSKLALSIKHQRIGECWALECADDKICQVYISPVLADPMEVLATLTHEIGHAALGYGIGHKAPFPKLMKSLLLEGKPTCTYAGEAFKQAARPILDKLGDLPHSRITPMVKEAKQSTRLLKVECGDCGYVARVTRKWIDAAGPPICPSCEEQMKVQE